MFLSAQELTIVTTDFERLLTGAEATPITLRYAATGFPGAPPVIDKAFNRNVGPIDPMGLKTATIKAIQEHVKPRSIKLLSIGYLEVGDCIFYFSKSVNLQQPVSGYDVTWDSLRVIDPSGVLWRPKVLPTSVQGKLATERLGSDQICQVLACHPEA
jgi:hypothetical protein